MIKEKLIMIFQNNSGKIIGSLIGLILAISIFTIGLFKTLFMGLLVMLGFFIGDKIDKKEDLLELVERIIRYRNRF